MRVLLAPALLPLSTDLSSLLFAESGGVKTARGTTNPLFLPPSLLLLCAVVALHWDVVRAGPFTVTGPVCWGKPKCNCQGILLLLLELLDLFTALRSLGIGVFVVIAGIPVNVLVVLPTANWSVHCMAKVVF